LGLTPPPPLGWQHGTSNHATDAWSLTYRSPLQQLVNPTPMLPRWFEMTLLHESVSLLNVLTIGNNWQTFILVGRTYGHLSQEVGFTGSIPTTPTNPTATIKKHSWAGVTLSTCGATSTQLNNGVVSSGV